MSPIRGSVKPLGLGGSAYGAGRLWCREAAVGRVGLRWCGRTVGLESYRAREFYPLCGDRQRLLWEEGPLRT